MARRVALGVALALVAGCLLLPAHAAETYGSTTVTYIVPSRHGGLFLEVAHPTLDGEIVRAPMVLTYSPYSVLGRNGDADKWTALGYARAWADVVGTGNSGGCYDYGGRREKQTGYDLVEWVAQQPWNSQRVGMIGGSYNGTTATATATQRPPHLMTIVPEAAISRWYGYAYSGGIRYTDTNEQFGHQGPGAVADEGFDTPLGFDFGFALPPPVDVEGDAWQERVLSTIVPCEEFQHTYKGYELTPDYDVFWHERDYLVDAAKITIPVLVSHNWGDWNVKQEEGVNLWRALTNSRFKRLYMGTRWDGHGTPGGEYGNTVIEWMDRWLKGEQNGLERRLPPVVSQTSTSAGPGDFLAGPVPVAKPVRLYATAGSRSFSLTAEPAVDVTLPLNAAGSESKAAAMPELEAGWLYFETPPLARDTRLFGNVLVDIRSTIDRSWVTYTPSILDVDPALHGEPLGMVQDSSQVVAFTRGWLDSRYRHGLEKQAMVLPNRPFTMRVVAKPQDYVVKAGHKIGLLLQSESLEWAVAKLYPCSSAMCQVATVHLGPGRTSIVLPVVNAPKDLPDLFA